MNLDADAGPRDPDQCEYLPVSEQPAGDCDDFYRQIELTIAKLKADGPARGDVKMLSTAFRELRYALKVFRTLRNRRKVTVFGSARTRPDHPAYLAAKDFGARMAAHGYMVVTGAGNGIMEAAHEGAGREQSIGLNIRLPFEQASNKIIDGDPKLVTFKYFFTRKLLFLKESHAVVVLPGGFGTHDEAFEALTLVQTGKSHIFPIVFLDEPGGDYWTDWHKFITKHLLDAKWISPPDVNLFMVTDSVEAAEREVMQFYRVYHSMRYVGKDLILRLRHPLSDATMHTLQTDYRSILVSGDYRQTEADPAEANEPNIWNLPRLRLHFDQQQMGRLRKVIDIINLD